MYGVRVMIDGQVADLEIFEGLPAARERFEQGWSQAYEGYFDSIAIFDVPDATDVRDAAAAIRSGDDDRIILVDLRESFDTVIEKIAKKIEIEI
ncbi:MAG: hypothetical protein M3N07_00230 [Pseudomonadota bacterium]|nr:hypothetical protein [Pseudomonadota bacterium]